VAIILALEKLYSDVTARFAADQRNVPQAFGWRAPSAQAPLPERIVWVPGDDESGDLGVVDPPKYPGRNPRPLATLYEIFTCRIAAHDPASPADEALQYRATRLLFDEWYRAVRNAAPGQFEILKARWITDKNQFRYGAAIRVLGAIQSMIPDYTLLGAPVDTKAAVTVVELDRSESFTAPP
jgi:hypothetical protein